MQNIQQTALDLPRRQAHIVGIEKHQGETDMAKLISTFRAAPTAANHAKLARYLYRHAMAVCLATAEDFEFLKANGFDV